MSPASRVIWTACGVTCAAPVETILRRGFARRMAPPVQAGLSDPEIALCFEYSGGRRSHRLGQIVAAHETAKPWDKETA